MWGAGCVFGEMYTRKPILTGQSDLHQAQLIFELVGTPNDENMPGWFQLPKADVVQNMEPTCVENMVEDVKWEHTIDEKMVALDANDTWDLVPSPESTNVAGCN